MDSLKQNVYRNRVKKIVIRTLSFLLLLLGYNLCIGNNVLLHNYEAFLVVLIIYFILDTLLVTYIFPKILKIRDDDLLRYKNCKASKNCESCHIDALLNNMFKFTPDLICFKDPKLRYVTCSRFFKECFGFTSESDFIGKTPLELFDYDIASLICKNDRIVLQKKEPQTYVVEFLIKGEKVLYELVSAPIISKNRVVGILTLSRDITESRHITEALEFSNTQLYSLINNAPMLAFVLDTDDNLILGNARAKDFLLTGLDVTIDGEKIQFDVDDLKKYIHIENSRVISAGGSFQSEKRLIAKNGESYWYLAHQTPMRNKDGEIYAVTTFLRNIDAEKKMTEERETYIATLSHDLKTPTIAQVRALELLLSGQLGELNSDQKEMLKLTLDSCNYMYDMVYTLLSTYKFENGEISLNYSTFDLAGMISECIHEISNLASANSITLVFHFNNNDCEVFADRIELKRVIINLLSNAINYAYSASNVDVYLANIEGNIEVKVINAGPFIESEVLDKLFRKYVTHSEKFNKVGIGLGLYLSKKIIEAHNGKILAESNQDNKNMFGFIIPQVCSKNDKFPNKVEAL